ncbi:MAG: acyltransferase [Rhizomicrobium sp.]
MATRRYGTLDGLRGIAAFMVLIGHLAGPFYPFTLHGYLAVDLFFLMSGFVVAAAYETRLRAGWGVARFALVRLKRLWPVYALSFVLAIACYLTVRAVKPSDDFLFPALPLASVVAMGLLFIPQFVRYGGGALFPLDPAAWSLSTEMFGNIVYAAAAPSLSDRTLKILIGIGAFGIAITAFRKGGLNVGFDAVTVVWGYLRFAFSFPAGVLLYRLHAAGRLPRLPVPPWLVLAATVLLLSGPAPLVALYDTIVVLFLFPAITVAALSREPQARFAPFFAWCGAVSYPLYVLHQPITGMVLSIVPRGIGHVVLVLCLPVAIIAMAAAAERWFERPVQRWFKARRHGVSPGDGAVIREPAA